MNYNDVCAIVEEEFSALAKQYEQYKDCLGAFLEDLNISVPLLLPYPVGYKLVVKGYDDYYDEDNHIIVKVLDNDMKEIASSRTSEGRADLQDLDYAISQALFSLACHGWSLSDVKAAWERYRDVMKQATDVKQLPCCFMHWNAGTPCAEVEKFFENHYPGGVVALASGAEAGDKKIATVDLSVQMEFTSAERDILMNGTLSEKQALLLDKIANLQFRSQKAFMRCTTHCAHKNGYEWFLGHHIQVPLEKHD